MLLSATLVLLGFWLTIIWYCDIDGFRRTRSRGTSREDLRYPETAANPRTDGEDRDAATPNC